MFGAIIGDICGSYHEFKDAKGFFLPLNVIGHSSFTDDSVLTCATASKLLGEHETFASAYRDAFHKYKNQNSNGEGSIDIGYGSHFTKWALGTSVDGYGSKGNGSAMRISPVAYFADSETGTLELARESAESTHNSKEAVFAAQATALAIYLCLEGILTPKQINDRIELMSASVYSGYENPYTKTLNLKELNKNYKFSALADKSVPIAIKVGLQARSFEEAVRMCLYIGGDCDTTAAIAGSIAEARHGIPVEMMNVSFVFAMYAKDLSKTAHSFYETYCEPKIPKTQATLTFSQRMVWKAIDLKIPFAEKSLNSL
ncbi:ADP-ribosylglycohydrolase family protein [Vibrio crassostreae]|uniref:ADP-ribosylglycohydrolase family protein n=1 Tax=Vibrio crassostreae TaxID=246167 RepID=UPI001B3088D3|nr:ADP-ribosylglycohydrolase family protein [Vibrio crassostreae]